MLSPLKHITEEQEKVNLIKKYIYYHTPVM